MISKLKNILKTGFKTLVFALPVAFAFGNSVACVAHVDGKSMQPTLNPGNQKDVKFSDLVLQDKLSIKPFYDVKRQDIVCLVDPKNSDACMIKRIIGLEGDLINPRGNMEVFLKVPKGHIWVEGDNTKSSRDSTAFGPVPLGLVYAKATHIVWPLHRIGRLE